MDWPVPSPSDCPVRVLFAFATLGDGRTETRLQLLADTLDPQRYRIDAFASNWRRPAGAAWPVSTRIEIDRSACNMTDADRIAYLARRIPDYDVIVSSSTMPDVVEALERLHHRPPLVEHRSRLTDAGQRPHPLVSRWVCASPAICAATALQLSDRPTHPAVHMIPPVMSGVDGHPHRRNPVFPYARAGAAVGWVGPVTDAKQSERFLNFAQRMYAENLPVAFYTGGSGADGAIFRLLQQSGRAAGIRPVTDPTQFVNSVGVVVCDRLRDMTPDMMADAAAHSLPVIALTNPAPFAVGGAGAAGTSPENVVAATCRLLRDPAARLQAGQAQHRQITAVSEKTAVAAQWAALFDDVLAEVETPEPKLFRSFIHGGFEASTHRLRNGKRLDVISATGHDLHAKGDYRQLGQLGLRTVRDAARWHLIEQQPNRFDFSSFVPMAEAARDARTQVIWDLMHYGWPDDIDIWSPAFVDRFATFARAVARVWKETSDDVPFWCPINEISFFSWGGGEVGHLNPFATGRGLELKVQLARAGVAAMHALRDVDPRARFVHCEPLISIHHDATAGHPRSETEGLHDSQYQAFDMLRGTLWPQIGGDPSFLDVIGVNYYHRNQWFHNGATLDVDHPAYRPLSDLLFEVYARYNRPVLISETGIEDGRRASWFRYVADEAARARKRGVPVEGLCLYPVMNHPGWDDDRACQNGLLTQHFEGAQRGLHQPLADAVAQEIAARHTRSAAWQRAKSLRQGGMGRG